MSYEEKYKQALERMKSWVRGEHPECFCEAQKAAEFIFPELAESEDERIRKELIAHCRNTRCVTEEGAEQVRNWIAWLEKQGENKPDDEVKPKFKVGDLIKHNKVNIICKVISVNSGSYYVENIETGGRNELCNAEQNFHLWTMADAKDGDVLANDHHILILKELVYDWSSNGTPYSVKAYCGIKPDGNFEIGKDNWCFCGILHIHPATKEQRDLLLQKMKESGYEWDGKKKEVKKIVWLEKQDQETSWKPTYQQMEELDRLINGSFYDPEEIRELQKQLESLRKGCGSSNCGDEELKPQWKPTKEQMVKLDHLISGRSLDHLISGCSYDIEVIKELQKQLESLRK